MFNLSSALLEYFLLKYGLSWLHDDGAYFGFDIKLILYISTSP